MSESSYLLTENVDCPLCGSSANELFDRRIFREIPLTNRVCTTCGFVYQSPRMTQGELEKFYLNEYRLLYQGDSSPIAKDLAVQTSRADNLLKFTQKNGIQHLRRHLDIGSSSGLLLEKFKSAYWCDSVGVEPGQAYREAAQKTGLKVYQNLEDLSPITEDRFELISLVHVVEHFADPVKTLSELREKWLTQDGRLLVEVPNLYCHDCFELAHLASYSLHTLRETLIKAGFQIVAVKKYGLPRSKVLPLYLLVLAKRSPMDKKRILQEVKPEGRVRFKRQTGMLLRRLVERLLPGLAWLPVK
jgi:SAM-dependent methyltransferase